MFLIWGFVDRQVFGPGLMRPMGMTRILSVLQPRFGHSLTQTTFFNEILFQATNLLVQKVVVQ